MSYAEKTRIANATGAIINPATKENQDSLNTAVGEVAVSPTNNTVLARLKDLLTGIVLAAGANIIGKVGIDQTTPGTTNKVSAAQSGGWNITDISGTVSLPTGAATSANQTNGAQIAQAYLTDENGVQSQMLGDTLYSGAPIVIDVDHHEIHCGDSFTTTRSVDLGNGATDTLIVNVPAATGGRLYHVTFDINTESEADFNIYEDVTTVADGTTISNFNRDRNSGNTSSLVVTHTPTTPTAGTNIYTEHWGAGKTSGGETRGQKEFILKSSTKYRVTLTNSTTSNNYISWKINHYIHPGQ